MPAPMIIEITQAARLNRKLTMFCATKRPPQLSTRAPLLVNSTSGSQATALPMT